MILTSYTTDAYDRSLLMIQKGPLSMQLRILSSIWSARNQDLVKFSSADRFSGCQGAECSSTISYQSLFCPMTWFCFLNFLFRLMKKKISSRESSLKDLHELASHLFTAKKTASEEIQNTNAEVENKKKQQNKEIHSNANLISLARFLLSRFVQQ